MNSKTWKVCCLFLLITGSASAANVKNPKKDAQKTNTEAFALVTVLAQEHNLPFYNFAMQYERPAAKAVAFIEYNPKTGKFEQKHSVLPIQIQQKAFKAPKSSPK